MKKYALQFAIISFVHITAGNAGSMKVIYNFSGGVDGGVPAGGLIRETSNTLLGMTSGGGAENNGTVFSLSFNPISGKWKKETIWSFTLDEGALPQERLIRDTNGDVYGTTWKGGHFGLGTLFRLRPPSINKSNWNFDKIWDFGGDGDGAVPSSILLTGDGQIFGTTFSGGTSGLGTIYSLSHVRGVDPHPLEKVLWNFTGGNDGMSPAALINTRNGRFYGITNGGGLYGVGNVFEFVNSRSGDNSVTPLWSFDYTASGGNPNSLLMASSGRLFGTLVTGKNTNSFGAVFELSHHLGHWKESEVLSLPGGIGGSSPMYLQLQGTSSLVGLTQEGGAPSCLTGHVQVPCGTVFKLLSPNSINAGKKETTLWDFAPPPSPSGIAGPLLTDSQSGRYFGETNSGGTGNFGTVFLLEE